MKQTPTTLLATTIRRSMLAKDGRGRAQAARLCSQALGGSPTDVLAARAAANLGEWLARQKLEPLKARHQQIRFGPMLSTTPVGAGGGGGTGVSTRGFATAVYVAIGGGGSGGGSSYTQGDSDDQGHPSYVKNVWSGQ